MFTYSACLAPDGRFGYYRPTRSVRLQRLFILCNVPVISISSILIVLVRSLLSIKVGAVPSVAGADQYTRFPLLIDSPAIT